MTYEDGNKIKNINYEAIEIRSILSRYGEWAPLSDSFSLTSLVDEGVHT